MNQINSWKQGFFIDSPRYPKNKEWKDERRKEEKLLVRPSPKGNAICKAIDPELAKWIADRLNLASDLEELTYNFVTNKPNSEKELINYINNKLEDI